MPVTESNATQHPGRGGNIFLGVAGVASLTAAEVGSYTGVHDFVVIAFILAGGILVVAAPVLHRLKTFALSPTEAKLEISPEELAVAEYQADKGEVIEASEAIDASLPIEVTATAGAEVTHPGEIPIERSPPHVVLAQVAAEELALFNPDEREAIAEELPKVGSRDQHEYGLRWGLQPNQQYRARRVGEDIRIYFRQREKTTPVEPDSFVVLGFQKAEPLEPGHERLGRMPFRR